MGAVIKEDLIDAMTRRTTTITCVMRIFLNGKRNLLLIKTKTNPRNVMGRNGGGAHTISSGAFTNHPNVTKHPVIIATLVRSLTPPTTQTAIQAVKLQLAQRHNFAYKVQSLPFAKTLKNDGAAQGNALFLSIERNKRRKSCLCWPRLLPLHNQQEKRPKNYILLIQTPTLLVLIIDVQHVSRLVYPTSFHLL